MTILDENDNVPMFDKLLYEVTLDEGPMTLNSVIITTTAVDRDEGLNGTVSYSILSGNLQNTFTINNSTVRSKHQALSNNKTHFERERYCIVRTKLKLRLPVLFVHFFKKQNKCIVIICNIHIT